MNTTTALTERLIARWTEILENADRVEAEGHPAFARGLRQAAETMAQELRARGWRLRPRSFSEN